MSRHKPLLCTLLAVWLSCQVTGDTGPVFPLELHQRSKHLYSPSCVRPRFPTHGDITSPSSSHSVSVLRLQSTPVIHPFGKGFFQSICYICYICIYGIYGIYAIYAIYAIYSMYIIYCIYIRYICYIWYIWYLWYIRYICYMLYMEIPGIL